MASVLCNKIGHRLTCGLGGFLIVGGLLTSAFANDVYILFLTYGLITGEKKGRLLVFVGLIHKAPVKLR